MGQGVAACDWLGRCGLGSINPSGRDFSGEASMTLG